MIKLPEVDITKVKKLNEGFDICLKPKWKTIKMKTKIKSIKKWIPKVIL